MLQIDIQEFPTITTERLKLVRLTEEHTNDMHILRNDVDAMRHLGKPLPVSIEEIKRLIQTIEEGIRQNESVGWGITLQGDKQVIGTIGFHRIEKQHHRAEIGYMLLPDFWTKGIMSEAFKPVLDYGFNVLNFHSIMANVDPENYRSVNLLKKFGFVKEAYFKENYFFEGRFLDSEIYSLLGRYYPLT